MNWKIKYAITLFAIAVSCVAAPILLWHDWLKGDWFMMSIDITIIFLWADWLYRAFKKQN